MARIGQVTRMRWEPLGWVFFLLTSQSELSQSQLPSTALEPMMALLDHLDSYHLTSAQYTLCST